jgi:hypothetical protein
MGFKVLEGMGSQRALQVSAVIRPFREDDIGQVAELHRSVFATGPSMSAGLLDRYRSYFREVFFNHPCQREDLPSLVYEEEGKVMGFVGSVARPMRFRGRPVLARLTSQFAVDPRCRGMVGVKLLQTILNGPQDLTVADEANTPSRTIWEAVGGTTARLNSFTWIYPFRPCSVAVSVMARRGRVAGALAGISAPAARFVDWFTTRMRVNPFLPDEPRLAGNEMDSATLLANLSTGLNQSLQPVYDPNSLEWALGRASRYEHRGELRKVVVKTKKQETAGWYISYANPGGVEDVSQISAKPAVARDIFDHLLHGAHQRGAAAVTGAFDPVFMESYVERRCLMRCGPWVLVHSRNPELTRAFQDGDVFFSRLEGEWCLHFR